MCLSSRYVGLLDSIELSGAKSRFPVGEKEVDDPGDFWADHDDDCHGDPSILIHDDDDGTSQEGTVWSCCDDNDGFHKGCVRTRHVPGQNSSGSKKKTKYGY